MKKKIVLITGTRADFGKIKSVIQKLLNSNFDIKIFITGMHLDKKYGFTYNEVKKNFPTKILHKFINYNRSESQDIRYFHQKGKLLMVRHFQSLEIFSLCHKE